MKNVMTIVEKHVVAAGKLRPDAFGVVAVGAVDDDFVVPAVGDEVTVRGSDGRALQTTLRGVEEVRTCFSAARHVMILLGEEITAADVSVGSKVMVASVKRP